MNFNKSNKKIGFIGVGNMASAIIRGITSVGGYSWDNIYLYDVESTKTAEFASLGSHAVDSVRTLCEASDCIVLAVKPQNFPEVLAELAPCVKGRKILFISIAAGITTETVSNALGGVGVVRALPNTPMLIGKGVTAICSNSAVSEEDMSFARAIFTTAGDVVSIDESQMNPIISVTSSSPAYVFKFIKAVCDGARAQGLDDESIKQSVCSMVAGAAMMLAQSDRSPEELVSMVCSKGGTTERAVSELDRYSFEEAIVSAMKKCTERADELSGISK